MSVKGARPSVTEYTCHAPAIVSSIEKKGFARRQRIPLGHPHVAVGEPYRVASAGGRTRAGGVVLRASAGLAAALIVDRVDNLGSSFVAARDHRQQQHRRAGAIRRSTKRGLILA
jgi:hypothetical protein